MIDHCEYVRQLFLLEQEQVLSAHLVDLSPRMEPKRYIVARRAALAERREPDGRTATGSQAKREVVDGCDGALLNDHRIGFSPIIRVIPITVDFGAISPAGIEKAQRNIEAAFLLVADGADEPHG